MKICPHCQAPNFEANIKCKKCQNGLDGSKQMKVNFNSTFAESKSADLSPMEFSSPQLQVTQDNSGFTQREYLGFVGSILLFIGVFCPIVTIPIVGSVNYFRNGYGDGVIIIVLAAGAFFSTLQRAWKGVMIIAVLSLGVMAFTFFNFHYRMNYAREQIAKDLSNNPFNKIGETMVDMVELSWGWAILGIGAFCLLAAALWKSQTNKSWVVSQK
jgi:hypothetical protein